MTDRTISLKVNGADCTGHPRQGLSLLEFVREELGLKAAKLGCSAGDCGACTMLVDGVAVQSCQVPLSSAEGVSVQTVEALVSVEPGARIAERLIDAGAAQCGYCLPGIVAAATGAFARDGAATDIATALERNLCRCGTHTRILRALRQVRDDMAKGAR